MLDIYLVPSTVTGRPAGSAGGLQEHRSRPAHPTIVVMVTRRSAGIVLFRRLAGSNGWFEVLLGHPGGPFFTRRDEGHWTIPKGEPDHPDDDLLAVARREFEEETGKPAPHDPGANDPIQLGTIVQKRGKVVHAWAIEGDMDATTARSNTFVMEWPPWSGQQQEFAEIDRVAWFEPDEARRRLKPTQVPFVDRLAAILDGSDPGDASDPKPDDS